MENVAPGSMGPDSQSGPRPTRETSPSVALVHTIASRMSTRTVSGSSPSSPMVTSASASAVPPNASSREAVRAARESPRSMGGSVAAALDAPGNHNPEGPQQDLQVQNGRPVHQVLQVMAQLVLGVGVIPPVDLREPSDTGRDLVPAGVAGDELLELGGELGSLR